MMIQRRDQDHVKAWSQDKMAWQMQSRREIEHVEKQLEAARAELAERPVRIIKENLDAEAVAYANSQRDAAYRSRDRIMQSLCIIRLLHRESDPGKCSCGSPRSKCKTTQAVSEIEVALDKWERRQVTQMRQGLSHYLPDNHPAVLDPRINY